jgi:pimeloyl-ACP methyl ester carboxylesterase
LNVSDAGDSFIDMAGLMNVHPFRVDVTEERLVDLRARLDRARWPATAGSAGWTYGMDATYLRELVDYWRNGYDWRNTERAINRFHQFSTEIEAQPVHFVHERGQGPKPVPLLLNHGWPWTFWDYQKVIRQLADPGSHGGDPQDAFDVVVPSQPGYAFSTPLNVLGLDFAHVAGMWDILMRKVLGYERYGVQGGDWGGLVASHLGHSVQQVIGVHLHLPVPMATGFRVASHAAAPSGPAAIGEDDWSNEEAGWRQKNAAFYEDQLGYFLIQATKPEALSYAMDDSPLGLCAWLIDKRRSWSDCGGHVERRFSKDDLLDSVMLFWLTQSLGSSARTYYEGAHVPWRPVHDKLPVVQAPTGVALFLHEVVLHPRRWAERYYNLKRWTVHPSGGHFAPMEEPEILVKEIRAFFRPLR